MQNYKLLEDEQIAISEETEKLVGAASDQKLIEYLSTGNKLYGERKGEILEIAFNSVKELCFVEIINGARSLKLIRNSGRIELTKESRRELGEYLKREEGVSPEVSERVSMTRLAAAIAVKEEPTKLFQMMDSYNLEIGYIYDSKKDTAENARKIYVLLANHMYTKECSFNLVSGRYGQIKAQVEIPSDNGLARDIRSEIEKNQELTMKFEKSNNPGKCLLIVKRAKKV